MDWQDFIVWTNVSFCAGMRSLCDKIISTSAAPFNVLYNPQFLVSLQICDLLENPSGTP